MTLDELYMECSMRNPKDGPFELPYEDWLPLNQAMKKYRDEEGKPFLCDNIDRVNFLCGGTPVVIKA